MKAIRDPGGFGFTSTNHYGISRIALAALPRPPPPAGGLAGPNAYSSGSCSSSIRRFGHRFVTRTSSLLSPARSQGQFILRQSQDSQAQSGKKAKRNSAPAAG